MNYSALFCIKFDFGVPLEDIFPPNDIHPRLLNLFQQTEIAISNSPLTLHEILGNFQGSLKEKLSLKEDLVEGKLRYRRHLNPGGFIWLIRHFLGLLPLPLFPLYTDGREYNWDLLVTQCKYWGVRENYQLDSDISWTINRLPTVNVILIHCLLQFLRKISSKYDSSEKLDKRKVVAIVKYFCSSLFLRPYVPGFVFRSDKLHYPLLYYLIHNWPRIEKLKYHQLSLVSEELLKLPSIRENEETESICSSTSVAIGFVEFGCQTSSWLLTEKNEETTILSHQESVSILCKKIEEQFQEISTVDSFTQSEQHFNSRCREGEASDKIDSFKCSDNSGYNVTKDDEGQSEKNEEISEEIDSIFKTETKSEHLYESPKYLSLNCSSETAIYKKARKDQLPRDFIRRKIVKANRSLANVISKFNEKMRTRQEADVKLGNCKYDLLAEASLPTKLSTPKLRSSSNCSPHIKYKKLLTL